MSYLPWPTPPDTWQRWSYVDALVADRSAGRLHVTVTDTGTFRLRRVGGLPLGPDAPYVELPDAGDNVAERVDAAVATYLG